MVKLTDHIWFVEAPNKARFPYCHCLLIDDERRALMDTSCGEENLRKLLKSPIDIIINTHFHEDHILCNYRFPNAEVWIHTLDASAVRTLPGFLEHYGFSEFDGDAIGQAFIASIDLHASPVHREFADREVLDFGRTRLQVIHTPGHTPGHCAFYEEKSGLLFVADIDLSSFGPWYAHRCSDIDDFIKSIRCCAEIDPKIVVSSHKGIITDNIKGRLKAYEEVIYRKEEEIVQALKVPSTVEELAAQQIIYGKNHTLDEFMMWFEKMAVLQHLKRLVKHNRAAENEGRYYLK
jgi:glyoxylase-like metal-dependent hydrolase (beta-lactamase superfamily II)